MTQCNIPVGSTSAFHPATRNVSRRGPCRSTTIARPPLGSQQIVRRQGAFPGAFLPSGVGQRPHPSRQGPVAGPACYQSATILSRSGPIQRDLDRQDTAPKCLLRWAQVFLGLGVEGLLIRWSQVRLLHGPPVKSMGYYITAQPCSSPRSSTASARASSRRPCFEMARKGRRFYG